MQALYKPWLTMMSIGDTRARASEITLWWDEPNSPSLVEVPNVRTLTCRGRQETTLPGLRHSDEP
jgi:hypothetical protein